MYIKKMYQWLCTRIARTPLHQRCFGAFSLLCPLPDQDGNLKLWCVVQHYDEYHYITTYLGYGCVLCHKPALEYRHSAGQYWYMSLPGPNAAHIYIFILNNFLSTNFGAKASEYQTSFITCISWDLFWVTAGPRTIIDGKLQSLRFQGPLIPGHVVVEVTTDWQFITIWPHSKAKSCFYLS